MKYVTMNIALYDPLLSFTLKKQYNAITPTYADSCSILALSLRYHVRVSV